MLVAGGRETVGTLVARGEYFVDTSSWRRALFSPLGVLGGSVEAGDLEDVRLTVGVDRHGRTFRNEDSWKDKISRSVAATWGLARSRDFLFTLFEWPIS